MSPVKLGCGAARPGMAGELWLGWERFCAVRSCMVWFGRQGLACIGMERKCLAGEARYVPFRYVLERMGSVRQAIKGGE